MQLIKTKKFNKRIEKKNKQILEAKKEGLYLIKISAKAKSEKQIGPQITDDDDLRLEIDKHKFPKLDNPQRYFDSPASFSGGQLHNLRKTVYFLINFSENIHNFVLIPDKNPFLEELSIYFIGNNLTEIDLDIDQQAEDRDRKPWITFALVDLPLKSLTVKITTKKRFRDSDDVKLIIDNQIQKNKSSIFHRDWLWAGSVRKWLFRKETQAKTIDSNLVSDLHYIEFWADRLPILHNLKLDFGTSIKRIPNVYDPKWTGNFNDDTEQMILARAIWGEARGASKKARIAVAWSIKNRLDFKAEWDTYHNIILDPAQYSAFWEQPPDDYNLKALRNPLKKANDLQKWKETYKIAEQIIKEEISDPTDGANHYYDDSILTPNWATKNNLKIEIDNLNFHKL